jgi:hypothetical protein
MSPEDTEQDVLISGAVIEGKYLVHRVIGRGGMCIVGSATLAIAESRGPPPARREQSTSTSLSVVPAVRSGAAGVSVQGGF